MTDLDALLAVSHRYGADPAFVLAGGGNTSFKSRDRLWVKASGHPLATIAPDGFVEMDRGKLDKMLTADWPDDPGRRETVFIERILAARVRPELGQRPSVETLLHHLLPEPLVVHTHPGVVNAVTCCVVGERLTRGWFDDEVLWQPYVDPGLTLARSLRAGLAGRRLKAIFLQNHGLIVGGESIDVIAAATDDIVKKISGRLPHAESSPFCGGPGGTRFDVPKRVSSGQPLKRKSEFVSTRYADELRSFRPELNLVFDDGDAARWIADRPDVATIGPLTPDQIVYCRSVPLVIDDDWVAAWRRYEETHGFAPWVGVVPGAGVLTFRESAKMAAVTRDVYLDAARISRDATVLGGVRPLDDRDRQFIESWEVEAYRRSIMTRSAEEKPQ